MDKAIRRRAVRSGCLLASLFTIVACNPQAVRSNDSPARALKVQVATENDALPGNLYLAAGAGPHPTLIWFHGFPGLPEPMPEAAGTLRAAGLNVLYVHYTGSWGTTGSFSPEQAVEDAAATLAQVRAAPSGWHVDPGRIIVGGDSFGSWLALQAAADPGVSCVATALVLDLGRLGRDLATDAGMRAAFGGMFQQVDDDPALGYTLQGGSEGMLAAIMDRAGRNSLVAHAAALRERPVLLIGAAEDTLAPIDAHLTPVAVALEAAGADVTRLVMPGGHELADADYAGQVASWIRTDCLGLE